jgi:hypothetical protein
MNDCTTPVCNNLTTVGEVEILAKIISVGVAVGAPGAVQQELYDGLALQASAKSGEVQ